MSESPGTEDADEKEKEALLEKLRDDAATWRKARRARDLQPESDIARGAGANKRAQVEATFNSTDNGYRRLVRRAEELGADEAELADTTGFSVEEIRQFRDERR
jgi:hypothetical protein